MIAHFRECQRGRWRQRENDEQTGAQRAALEVCFEPFPPVRDVVKDSPLLKRPDSFTYTKGKKSGARGPPGAKAGGVGSSTCICVNVYDISLGDHVSLSAPTTSSAPMYRIPKLEKGGKAWTVHGLSSPFPGKMEAERTYRIVTPGASRRVAG